MSGHYYPPLPLIAYVHLSFSRPRVFYNTQLQSSPDFPRTTPRRTRKQPQRVKRCGFFAPHFFFTPHFPTEPIVCAIKCLRKGTSRVNTIVENCRRHARASGLYSSEHRALRNFTPFQRCKRTRAPASEHADVLFYIFFFFFFGNCTRAFSRIFSQLGKYLTCNRCTRVGNVCIRMSRLLQRSWLFSLAR